MSRESTKKALFGYYERQQPKRSRSKKNERPEYDFKKIAKAWLEKEGFSINVVESRAVWSNSSGGYLRGQTDPGFSDLVGVTPIRGVACFIELKAPGRRSGIKDHQRDFLLNKIEKYAFAVCTDSIEHLSQIYSVWRHRFELGMLTEARDALVKDLPAKRVRAEKSVKGIPF